MPHSKEHRPYRRLADLIRTARPMPGQVWQDRRNGLRCRVVAVDMDARRVGKVHPGSVYEQVKWCSFETLITSYELVAGTR